MIKEHILLEILKAIPGTLSVVDTNYNILMVGGEIARTFEDTDQIIGKKCHTIFQERDNPCPWCKIDTVIKTGDTVDETTTPDDPREKLVGKPLNINIRPLKDKDGNIIGAIELGTDISHIREADEKRRRAEEALEKSEQKYRRIFESIQDVYYEVTIDGIILELSPSIGEVSQYKREELIGKSLYDIYMDPKKRDEFVKKLQDKGKVSDYEILLKDKEGSEVCCSITARLMSDNQRRPVKIIGSLRNIDERKRAEEALQKARDELETRVEERTIELLKANEQLEIEIEERERTEEKYKTLVESSLTGIFIHHEYRQIYRSRTYTFRYSRLPNRRIAGTALPNTNPS